MVTVELAQIHLLLQMKLMKSLVQPVDVSRVHLFKVHTILKFLMQLVINLSIALLMELSLESALELFCVHSSILSVILLLLQFQVILAHFNAQDLWLVKILLV